MIEDYHFIYSQWNGLLHICLPEPPSTPPEVMHRKFGLKNPKEDIADSLVLTHLGFNRSVCKRYIRCGDTLYTKVSHII